VKSAKLLSARKAEKHEFQSMLGELRDSCHIRLTAQGGHVRATKIGVPPVFSPCFSSSRVCKECVLQWLLVLIPQY
jgi:hypothetical protein